jgi:hypothetical protein
MKTTNLTIPELALIAGTRGMLGAGLGLLITNRLSESQRKTAGIILTAVGALTTIPLLFEVMGKIEETAPLEIVPSTKHRSMPDLEPVEA